MLGTLDDLKGKLDIAASDTSRDAALLLALETASSKVLDLCRYSEADVTGHQQVWRNVQFNRDLFTELRSIDQSTNAVVFEGRAVGEGTWSTLTGDVLDADEGRVIFLGWQAWWPPQGYQQPHEKWRDPVWPLVRITYDVTGIGNDPDGKRELVDAAASLAAFWFDRDLAGSKSLARLGPVSVEWVNEGLPKTLLEKLTKHLKHEAGAARWV